MAEARRFRLLRSPGSIRNYRSLNNVNIGVDDTCNGSEQDSGTQASRLTASFSAARRGTGGALPIKPDPQNSSNSIGGVDHVNLERLLGSLDAPFPFDTVQYNRCAMQLSPFTAVEEVHSLFSFLGMGEVWITLEGKLLGVLTDSALVQACLAGGLAA